MIRVEGNTIHVETRTLTATLTDGWVTSLKRRGGGAELMPQGAEAAKSGPAMELVYRGGEVVPLDTVVEGCVQTRGVSDHAAEVRFHSWYGDGVLFVREDAETGDLVVEPSAYSSRGGVRACRWRLAGFDRSLEVVAPFFQGVRLPADDPLLAGTHWQWPFQWEAAMVIFQGRPGGGFWVHAQDTQYRFKAVHIGSKATPHCIALDSEAFGPLEDNLSAGGLAWRINVHDGGWEGPAAAYRDWWQRTWRPQGVRRPDWLGELHLALSWCPCDAGVLDALAAVLPPRQVLLHVPGWRTDKYDQNYPTYEPSPAGREFVGRAQAMGFRVAPHFNAIDMDPTHPVYAAVRDFESRLADNQQLQGWAWAGHYLPCPSSNRALACNRDKNTMVKIHPGLGMWRSILGENIQRAAETLALETAFIDVTLCVFNLHKCIVDGQTPSEGMARLIEHVAGLGGGLTVGGEGLNEVTARGLSFAQAHLFQIWSIEAKDLARCGGAAVNDLLFGRFCRTIGYNGLGGGDEASAIKMRVHDQHGAIPTLTISKASDLTSPNAEVKALLERARE
jgi:hypothetical protein